MKLKQCLTLILAVIYIVPAAFATGSPTPAEEKKFIKWVDFTPCKEALDKALSLDIATHDSENPLPWIETLAYLAAKNNVNSSKFKSKDVDAFAAKRELETIEKMTEKLKSYSYYYEAYSAVLGGFVGDYSINTSQDKNNPVWEERYGLKAFSPIAKGYEYHDYDDFGAGRSYGYKRRHLGHDMMALTGTPVIAVESGRVEALGWNQYGGWRVGIRSLDGHRYYYYAHMRQNRPYHPDLKEGQTVKAGDVIGYVGRSGYSSKENTNNITQSHLHFGMQIIFDESQKDGNNEIWIDVYSIVRFLQKNKCETYRVDETKEHYRKYDFTEPELLKGESASGLPGESPSAEPVQVKVPIIMYHNITLNKSLLGRYGITPYEFEEDLRLLAKNGLESVTIAQLADFVYNGKPLPSKPIVLTFDDGNYGDFKYAFPLLKKYNQKAVMSVIGNFADKYSDEKDSCNNYPNLTWVQINEMIQSGQVEIQNHSYNMHGPLGSGKKSGESDEDYKLRFSSDLMKMQKRTLEMTGITPSCFTYPFGIMSRGTTFMLKELGFISSLSCREGENLITQGDFTSLFLLKRYIRPNNAQAWQVFHRAGAV